MRTSLPFLSLAFFLASPLLAQKEGDPTLSFGDKAPPVQATWLRGTKTMKKKPPEDYLLVLLAPGEQARGLLRSLGALEKRLRKAGMSVVAILCPEKGKAGPARAFFRKAAKGLRFPIGLDKKGTARKTWAEAMGFETLPIAVLVRGGHILWLGKAEEDLADQVDAALDGSLDFGRLWFSHHKSAKTRMGQLVLKKDIQGMADLVDKLLKKFPTSAMLLAQKHWAISKLQGREKADAFFRALLPKLTKKNPFAAIKLSEEYLGIRASDEMKEFMVSLLTNLSEGKGKASTEALLTLLGHWDRKKERLKAIHLAEAGMKRFSNDSWFVKRLTAKLYNSKRILAYRNVLKDIVAFRIKHDPKDMEAIRVRWEMASFLFDDKAERMKATKAYAANLDKQDDPDLLNGFVWQILTEDAFGPDYFPYALQGAKRILELKDPSHALLDTAALAFFKNGDKKKAVELEEKALAAAKKGGDERAIRSYTKSLEEFKK